MFLVVTFLKQICGLYIYNTRIYLALSFVSPLILLPPIVPRDNVNILVLITNGEFHDITDHKEKYRGRFVKKTLNSVKHNYDFVIPVGVGEYYNETALKSIRGWYDMGDFRIQKFSWLVEKVEPISNEFHKQYKRHAGLQQKKQNLLYNYFKKLVTA